MKPLFRLLCGDPLERSLDRKRQQHQEAIAASLRACDEKIASLKKKLDQQAVGPYQCDDDGHLTVREPIRP